MRMIFKITNEIFKKVSNLFLKKNFFKKKNLFFKHVLHISFVSDIMKKKDFIFFYMQNENSKIKFEQE